MKKLIIICSIVGFMGCGYAGPSDPLTFIIYGSIGCAILASTLTLVLGRKIIKETKPPVQKLIAWLITICVIAISFALWSARFLSMS